ncbi:hypothetical protein CGZ80_25355 [Rhodopirellula sp. MGV]|nr:hypothetical protein CGZ80_25355 [Rhodopirellula sp. MGV]
MHPRLPRFGKQQLRRSAVSFPIKTAGGPFKQSPGHIGPGTQGAVAPCLIPQAPPSVEPPIGVGGAVATGGVMQAGGGAGSENAGSGNLNGCKFSGSPSFLRQLPSLHSPPEPGSASVVVVGSGLKIRRPVESTAGRRNREQPPAVITIVATNVTTHIDSVTNDRQREPVASGLACFGDGIRFLATDRGHRSAIDWIDQDAAIMQ